MRSHCFRANCVFLVAGSCAFLCILGEWVLGTKRVGGSMSNICTYLCGSVTHANSAVTIGLLPWYLDRVVCLIVSIYGFLHFHQVSMLPTAVRG
jgi:hypothetical protein